MYRTLLEVWPRDGNYDAVVDYYRSEKILEGAIASGLAVSGELLVPVDRTGPIVVTSTWRTTEDYATWVSRREEHASQHVKMPELTIMPESGLNPAGRVVEIGISV